MLISLILRKCGLSLWMEKQHSVYHEEARWVELRRLEGSMKRNYKRREMFFDWQGMSSLRGEDTDYSEYRIQTWALEEARRRLEAEGILPDPDDEAKK